MNTPPDNPQTASAAAAGVVNDCWNRLGVRGDKSCPELRSAAHCRNCAVYASAAASLLDHPLSPAQLRASTEYLARPRSVEAAGTQSALIFRLGSEWLALPVAVFQEVLDQRPIHSLPHCRQGSLLGLVNVRGELLLCVALDRLLSVEPGPAPAADRQPALGRLLVLQRGGSRWVCPVDEVHGLRRYAAAELRPVPATVARATPKFTQGVLPGKDFSVGLLDAELLFYSLERSLA